MIGSAKGVIFFGGVATGKSLLSRKQLPTQIHDSDPNYAWWVKTTTTTMEELNRQRQETRTPPVWKRKRFSRNGMGTREDNGC